MANENTITVEAVNELSANLDAAAEELNTKTDAVDFVQLKNGLETLKGTDFANAERACRAAGDGSNNVANSSMFKARLAAKALNVPFVEIQQLPLAEYASVVTMVENFLLLNLAKRKAQGVL